VDRGAPALPPYNTIHAHLLDAAGKLVTAPGGYTLSYQAVNDRSRTP
jgi:hypothetical protein